VPNIFTVGAVLDYVGAIVADTSHAAPGGSIDRKYLQGLISGLAGGSIAHAADASRHLAARKGRRFAHTTMPLSGDQK
jgi:hypothetical protein